MENQEKEKLLSSISETQNTEQQIQKQKQLAQDNLFQGRKILDQKEYLEASKCFSKTILAFEHLLKNGSLKQEQIKYMMKETILPAYSNLSLCHLHLGSYETVITLTNQILNQNKSHVKALYRRGIAQKNLKKVYYYFIQFDEAIVDFKLAEKIDPSISELSSQEIAECKRLQILNRKKERKMAEKFISSYRQEKDNNVQNKQENQNRFLKCLRTIYNKIFQKKKEQ